MKPFDGEIAEIRKQLDRLKNNPDEVARLITEELIRIEVGHAKIRLLLTAIQSRK